MTVTEVIEHVFTTENPETGSQPPEYFCWVMFENETLFLTTTPTETLPLDASFEQFKEVAIAELERLGPAIGGTPSGDFNVHKVSWYPDDFVYMVTYDSNHIFSISIREEAADDIGIGLIARGGRSLDAETLKVATVRNFQGEVKNY